MASLLLRFSIDLKNHGDRNPQAVLFHRWFPNGEKDAITLELSTSIHFKIWFEQIECRESLLDAPLGVSSDVIPTLGKIETGPLRGLLEIRDCSKEELETAQEGRMGDPVYVQLGKRILKDLLCPSLSRFIATLRTNYGQHWIVDLPAWDSRSYSLGAYCSSILDLNSSTDGGKTWMPFRPDESKVTFEASFATSAEYFRKNLTKNDWMTFQEKIREGYVPSTAARLLAKSHELFDLGSTRYAFIEGVTALEVAIGELIKRNYKGNPPLQFNQFKDLGVNQQFIAIAAVSGLLNEEDLRNGLEAIKIRNEIVHEGVDLRGETGKTFYGLLEAVAKLMVGPGFKFPSVHSGNMKTSKERWDELGNECSKG